METVLKWIERVVVTARRLLIQQNCDVGVRGEIVSSIVREVDETLKSKDPVPSKHGVVLRRAGRPTPLGMPGNIPQENLLIQPSSATKFITLLQIISLPQSNQIHCTRAILVSKAISIP